MTCDGELLARHEPMLARSKVGAAGSILLTTGQPTSNRTGTSTNVWQLPPYAGRLPVKALDGVKVVGWWADDVTAAEIRSDIRAQECLRDLRTGNNADNDQFVIPTLQDVINLARARAKAKSVELGRPIGIYPETKHPTYFAARTLANGLQRMEDRLLQTLHANHGNLANAPVYIQSFEVSNLQCMAPLTKLRVVQLLHGGGRPHDFTVTGDTRTDADLATPAGLDFINDCVQGVGVNTNLVIPLVGGAAQRRRSA